MGIGSKLKRIGGELYRRIKWHRLRGTLNIVFPLFVVYFCFERIIENQEVSVSDSMGFNVSIVYGIFIAVAIVWLVKQIFFGGYDRTDTPTLPPPIDDESGGLERLVRYDISTIAKMVEIQEGIFHSLFGELSAPAEQIYTACSENPELAVGIYSQDLDMPVGIARVFPLTEEFAKKMISGDSSEVDITDDDILPVEQNITCEYIYVESIGVLDGNSEIAIRRSYKLINAFRRLLSEKYLKDSRYATVFAIAVTGDGEKWCKFAGMSIVNVVQFGNSNRKYPVYLRRMCAEDLWRLAE